MPEETKLILLVEHNPDHEALTVRALARSNLGAQVAVVRDGAEAIDWLHRRGKHADRREPDPHIVLRGLQLPTLDGLEVPRQIRDDPGTALLPVVILTSSQEETDLLMSYELRANSYIQKPVEFARFVDVLREIGLDWLSLNEPPPDTHEAP